MNTGHLAEETRLIALEAQIARVKELIRREVSGCGDGHVPIAPIERPWIKGIEQ